MPSFERASQNTQSKNPRNPYSYDKIMAYFNTGADPLDHSPVTRSNKVTISLMNTANFNESLTRMPKDQYKDTAGCDLSSIFMPFKTALRSNEENMPCFEKGADAISASGIGLPDLLPFRWEPHKTDVIYDRFWVGSGDGISGLVSSNERLLDNNRYRDISDIRGIGFRLPMMGVGWGYELSSGKAIPSGTATEISSYPEGKRDKVFKGGTLKGWEVDPSDYIAAPIDLRYDKDRHVWTCAGSGIGVPPGWGQYKVLTILNGANPGGIGWDYWRFP